MKTLDEIINAVRDGERPEYEELRYAICAMEALGVFHQSALFKLATAEAEGRKPVLVYSAQFQWEEHVRRTQVARSTSPKEWVGWNNDPDNPEFLKRRKQSQRIYEKLQAKSAGARERV